MAISLLLVKPVSVPDETLLVLETVASMVDLDNELGLKFTELIVDTAGLFIIELEDIVEV